MICFLNNQVIGRSNSSITQFHFPAPFCPLCSAHIEFFLADFIFCGVYCSHMFPLDPLSFEVLFTKWGPFSIGIFLSFMTRGQKKPYHTLMSQLGKYTKNGESNAVELYLVCMFVCLLIKRLVFTQYQRHTHLLDLCSVTKLYLSMRLS